jgi:hypothetical protein
MSPKLQKIIDRIDEKGLDSVAEMMGIGIDELIDTLSNLEILHLIDFEQFKQMDDENLENEIWVSLLRDKKSRGTAMKEIINSFSDVSFDGTDYFYELADVSDMKEWFSDSGRNYSHYAIAERILDDGDYDYFYHIDSDYVDLMDNVYDGLTNENKQYLRNRIVEKYGNDLIGVPSDEVTDVIEKIGTEDENGDYEFQVTNENVMDLFSDDDTMKYLFENYFDEIGSELYSLYTNANESAYYDEVHSEVWGALHSTFIDEDAKYGEEVKSNNKTFYKFKITKSLPYLIKTYFFDGNRCDSAFNHGSYDYFIYGGFGCQAWRKLEFRISDYPDYSRVKNNLNELLKDYI